MKQDSDRPRLDRAQIERQLKASVDALTPNVLDRIDLSTPQEQAFRVNEKASQVIRLQRRMRSAVLAVAACFCVVAIGTGAYRYHDQNQRIETIIGIDVNPSVELSVNHKDKVLSAVALNEEAAVILQGMDLSGVDLNVAVNAVIGSMVTQGYLDDLDNAILVTVTNDSIKKASALRAGVVQDIEKALEENQVQAVVYDQQAVELDEMKTLAQEYDISYGKAYFLTELIEQNRELSMEDMEALSMLTMEEIAEKITDSSYVLGQFADTTKETGQQFVPVEPTTPTPSTQESTAPETLPETTTQTQTPAATSPTVAETTTVALATTAAATEPVREDRVEIDYADYEDGNVYVYFVTKVNWKKPTVSVFDEEGNSYAARVEAANRGDCVISVSGLEGGKSYSFVLGGLTPVEGGGATTVTGYFDKPEIAEEEASEETPEESSQENTQPPPSDTAKPTASEPELESTTGKAPEQTEHPNEETTEANKQNKQIQPTA